MYVTAGVTNQPSFRLSEGFSATGKIGGSSSSRRPVHKHMHATKQYVHSDQIPERSRALTLSAKAEVVVVTAHHLAAERIDVAESARKR
jgi:hypothetical protein